MKTIRTFLFLFLLNMLLPHTQLRAQVVFQSSFDVSTTDDLYMAIENADSYLLSGGYGYFAINITGSLLYKHGYNTFGMAFSPIDGFIKDSSYYLLGNGGSIFNVAGPVLLRNDFNGNFQLIKLFDDSIGTQSTRLIGYSILNTYDSGFMIAAGYLTLNPSLRDHIVLIKTDSAGNKEWSKKYDVDSTHVGLEVTNIKETPDHGFVVGCTAMGTLSPAVLRIDSAGTLLWAKSLALGVPNVDGAKHLVLTSTGDIVIIYSRAAAGPVPTMGLLKMDTVGNLKWSKGYGGTNYSYARWCEQTTDGGFILTGWVDLESMGIVKTDVDGNLQWLRSYGVARYSKVVKQTSDNGYLIVGRQTGLNGSDGMIIKTDSLGHTGGCFEYSPTPVSYTFNDSLVDIAINVTNFVVMDTVINLLTDTLGTYTTICNSTGISEPTISTEPTTYPNPFTATLTVTHPSAKGSIFITDITGKEVYRTAFSNSTRQQLQLAGLQPGMYFLTVSTNGVASTKKIIKL